VFCVTVVALSYKRAGCVYSSPAQQRYYSARHYALSHAITIIAQRIHGGRAGAGVSHASRASWSLVVVT